MPKKLKDVSTLALASTLAFAALVGTTVAPNRTAASHTAPCGATQYGFASHGRESSQGKRIDGIRAEFENLEIQLCTGSTGAARNSYMWVAIEGSCGGSGNCILQLGMGRAEPQQGMGWWWAWGRSPLAPGCSGHTPVAPNVQRIGDWNGRQVRYEINRILSSTISLWAFSIDGSLRRDLAESQICWPNTFADWFGESMNRGSAIGGWDTGHLPNHLDAVANRYRVQGDPTWYGPGWTTGARCRL